MIGAGTAIAHSPVVAAPLAVALLLAPAVNKTLFAYQVAVTPSRLQGRVSSIIGTVAQALAPVGPIAAGALVEHVGNRATFACFAAVLGIDAVGATVNRSVRTMRLP